MNIGRNKIVDERKEIANMKYFIIEATRKDPVMLDKEALDKVTTEHFEFLDQGFEEGRLLLCGPKVSGDGGIIMIKGSSLCEVEDYISRDPLKISDVQEYRITEFRLYNCQSIAKDWFDL